jgi:hypothetical protein
VHGFLVGAWFREHVMRAWTRRVWALPQCVYVHALRRCAHGTWHVHTWLGVLRDTGLIMHSRYIGCWGT